MRAGGGWLCNALSVLELVREDGGKRKRLVAVPMAALARLRHRGGPEVCACGVRATAAAGAWRLARTSRT